MEHFSVPSYTGVTIKKYPVFDHPVECTSAFISRNSDVML